MNARNIFVALSAICLVAVVAGAFAGLVGPIEVGFVVALIAVGVLVTRESTKSRSRSEESR